MLLQRAPAKAAVYGTFGGGGTAATVTVSGTDSGGKPITPVSVAAIVADWVVPKTLGGSHHMMNDDLRSMLLLAVLLNYAGLEICTEVLDMQPWIS